MPWYKKRNLRLLYLWLFTCCMCVEATSGFDSQLINTLQMAPAFHQCTVIFPYRVSSTLVIYKLCLDLGNGRTDEKGEPAIEPGLLGFVNSSYQLGSIFAVPIAPWFAQRYGRRWSIMAGSLIMVVGAILQGFAQHGMVLDFSRLYESASANMTQSWNVHRFTHDSGHGDPLLHHLRCCVDRRAWSPQGARCPNIVV